MSIDNQVAQLMSSMTQSYASAQANTGQGLQGAWPPEGMGRRCILTGIDTKAELVKVGAKGPAQKSLPGVVVTFKWVYLRDTTDPNYKPEMGDKLAFDGRSFNLLPPTSMAALDEKTSARFGYDWERFRGHCSILTRKPPEACVDPMADLKTILDELAGGVAPQVDLKIEYRQPDKSKATVYKTEYCTDRVA